VARSEGGPVTTAFDPRAAMARCKAASSGPWEPSAAKNDVLDPKLDIIACFCEREDYEADAEFIAHAREDLPAALEALEEAQGGWNAAAAELARHDCNVGEFGCSAPDSKGPCTKHQLAEAQGRIGAIREAAELAPEVAIATILAILGESE